jgi:hypothetical protein
LRARPRVRPIPLLSPDISSPKPSPSLVNAFPVSSCTQELMPTGGGMSTTEEGVDRSPSMPAAKRSTREDKLPLSIKSISLAAMGAFALAPLGGSARRDAIPPSAGDASRAVKWTLGTTAGPTRDGAKAAFGNDEYKRTVGKRTDKRRENNDIFYESREVRHAAEGNFVSAVSESLTAYSLLLLQKSESIHAGIRNLYICIVSSPSDFPRRARSSSS